MNIQIQGLTKGASTDTDSLYAQLRNLMSDLQAQLNKHPTVNSRRDLKIPQGTKAQDVFVSLKGGILRVGMYDGRRIRYLGANDLQVLQSHGTNFKGTQTGTAAPTIPVNFPNPNDWGFYDRTAGAPGIYLCIHRPSTGTLSSLLI